MRQRYFVLRVWSQARHLPIITMVVIIGTAIMAAIIGTTITTIIIGIGHGLLAIPGTTVTGKAPSRATEPGALLRRFSVGAIEAAIFSQRSSF